MDKYNIPSIPTWYNGRRYRSRLEARWQCFFDTIGWRAEYEPSQINGFNPDFLIYCKSKAYPTQHIIVEVKPSIYIDETEIQLTYDKYCNTKSHILILSDMPFYQSQYDKTMVTIGVGSQYMAEPYKRSAMIDFQMKCRDDFGTMEVMWDGMVQNKVDRKIFLQTDFPPDNQIIRDLREVWITCGNEVQFQVKNKSNG